MFPLIVRRCVCLMLNCTFALISLSQSVCRESRLPSFFFFSPSFVWDAVLAPIVAQSSCARGANLSCFLRPKIKDWSSLQEEGIHTRANKYPDDWGSLKSAMFRIPLHVISCQQSCDAPTRISHLFLGGETCRSARRSPKQQHPQRPPLPHFPSPKLLLHRFP